MNETITVSKVVKMRDSTGIRAVPIFNDCKPLLKEIIRSAVVDRGKEQDRVYIVCGKVGKGKSNFTLLNSHLHDEIVKCETPIENITRNLLEFEERLSKVPKGSFLTIDEGSELGSERHGEKQVKVIKEKFTVMRKKAHLIYICFTNPLRINSYFREDRFRGIFVCKKLGTIYYYSANRYFDILPNITRDLGKSKATDLFLKYAPNYILRYVPEYKGRLRKQYEERKDGNIDEKLIMKERPLELPNGSCSLNEVRQILGCDIRTLNKYIVKYEVSIMAKGTHRYMTSEDINKLKGYIHNTHDIHDIHSSDNGHAIIGEE